MSRDINPFGLRMPPSLRSTLEDAAKDAGRSLNSEIIHRLMSGVSPQSPEQMKRTMVLEALLEALGQAQVWWDTDDRQEHEEALLRDTLDDVFSWYRRYERLGES